MRSKLIISFWWNLSGCWSTGSSWCHILSYWVIQWSCCQRMCAKRRVKLRSSGRCANMTMTCDATFGSTDSLTFSVFSEACSDMWFPQDESNLYKEWNPGSIYSFKNQMCRHWNMTSAVATINYVTPDYSSDAFLMSYLFKVQALQEVIPQWLRFSI